MSSCFDVAAAEPQVCKKLMYWRLPYPWSGIMHQGAGSFCQGLQKLSGLPIVHNIEAGIQCECPAYVAHAEFNSSAGSLQQLATMHCQGCEQLWVGISDQVKPLQHSQRELHDTKQSNIRVHGIVLGPACVICHVPGKATHDMQCNMTPALRCTASCQMQVPCAGEPKLQAPNISQWCTAHLLHIVHNLFTTG